MDDQEIIDRFWARNESAITAVNDKYHAYCRSIAIHILGNAEDAEEVVNDTYHRVWNAIPPTRPESLRAFVGKITRNLAFDKLDKVKARKRGAGQMNILLSELEEVLSSGRDFLDEMIETEEITAALNGFLSQQSV
ncbi:MAG: RNA polymerase subunit sigma-70, partial [Clostridium sp.]|nr:RNA polymerase subunit sigma-70 [Clostridium sp.]